MITSRTSPKTLTAVLIAGAVALGALSACNTIGGAGRDIESVGGAIDEAADDSKK
jgi:predicted small secreted protein